MTKFSVTMPLDCSQLTAGQRAGLSDAVRSRCAVPASVRVHDPDAMTAAEFGQDFGGPRSADEVVALARRRLALARDAETEPSAAETGYATLETLRNR
jgi:hypothetical protein